jgi:hypothetical protein
MHIRISAVEPWCARRLPFSELESIDFWVYPQSNSVLSEWNMFFDLLDDRADSHLCLLWDVRGWKCRTRTACAGHSNHGILCGRSSEDSICGAPSFFVLNSFLVMQVHHHRWGTLSLEDPRQLQLGPRFQEIISFYYFTFV